MNRVLEILMAVLADRVLIMVSLLLNFILFGYAVIYPDYLRFATAGLFSITAFIPVLKIQGGRYANKRTVQETDEAA